MKSDEKAILAKLPDYDDFMDLAESISKLSMEKSKLEISIRAAESDIVKKVTTDIAFFQNGKTPTMSIIDATYRYSGISGELIPQREALANITVSLERLKLQMDIYKTWVSIWQSLNSNARAARL